MVTESMSVQNQVRALSRIRRALAEAEAEVTESEREFLEASGIMPVQVEGALRSVHARIRVANGLIAAHAKELSDDYDDQKTPARTPSALMRAVRPEEQSEIRADIKEAFENSVELVRGKKPPAE
jgi:hypothetical protein